METWAFVRRLFFILLCLVLVSQPVEVNAANPALSALSQPSLTNPTSPKVPLTGALETHCVSDSVSSWVSGAYNVHEVITSCTVNAPEDGMLFISANASAGLAIGAYEGQFDLTLDGMLIDYTYRYINVYTDDSDGTDRSVEVSTIVSVQSGLRIVEFRGRLAVGDGPVKLWNPRLSVIFIPDEGTDLRLCHTSQSSSWNTDSSNFVEYLRCEIYTSISGYVFITADASLMPGNSAYFAEFRITVDNQYADKNLDRTIRIQTDSLSDGTDENLGLTTVQPVSGAGWHIIRLFAKRIGGPGLVIPTYGSLTALFLPAGSFTLTHCASYRFGTFTFNDQDVHIVEQCTADVLASGWVYISADATVSLSNYGYEAIFDISVDDPLMVYTVARRYINIWDMIDYNDWRGVALSELKYVGAGRHTFYFLVKRYMGGQIALTDPSLSVLMEGGHIFLPQVIR